LRYVEIGTDKYALALQFITRDQIAQSFELHGIIR
jgi:hypothetical protein